MGDVPERVFITMRRGADLLGATLDDDGRPVVTCGCDCGQVTDLVMEGADTARSVFEFEVAYTCDGCMTSHWLTFKLRDADG
jgi:hypothetical protein